MTLLERLDKALPSWRLDYDNNPLEAAYDLGLLDPDEADAALSGVKPVDLRDEQAAWERLAKAWDEAQAEDLGEEADADGE